MGIQEIGIEAEQWLLKMFVKARIKVLQPDALSFENGKWVLNEIKHQEVYTPPPFFGHGLPLWQIETRMKFQKDTGIRVRLVIRELEDKKVEKTGVTYIQWLDILEKGKHIDTGGEKPRRIYPIINFHVKRY